jgi:hypothetical protein
MAIRTTTTRLRHDSDATFREWIQEIETSFTTIGLVQTADTGQINTATATRPATSASGGFQIWRFNDSLQATFPVFLRIEYRTGSAATNPLVRIGIGTGTDGAGTLTGTASYVPLDINPQSSQVTDTTRNSYWCHKPGVLAWDYKVGASTQSCVGVIARTVDNTGAPSGDGLIAYHAGQSFLNTRYLRFGAGAAVGTTVTSVAVASLCHWPFDPTSSLVGADPQVATVWAPMPRFTPFVGFCGILDAEAAQGTTFTFTAVGTTSRTYMAGSNFPQMSANSRLKAAFIWEA